MLRYLFLFVSFNLFQIQKATEITEPNIALITAGALRSFAFVAKSWQQFIDLQDVHLFAHVVHGKKECPMVKDGLEKLMQLTKQKRGGVVEIGDLSKPLVRYDVDKIPKIFHPKFWYLFNSRKHAKGNIIDMYDRRARAFELAKNYAEDRGISWNLVFFMRLDSAIYAPRINPVDWITSLKTTGDQNRVIYAPKDCDRLIIGGWDDVMKMFQYDMVYNSLNALSIQAQLSISSKRNGLSEDLFTETIRQENLTRYDPNPHINFITLRTRHAMKYCSTNKQSFIRLSKDFSDLYDMPEWSDFVYGYSSKLSAGDEIASHKFRCGAESIAHNTSSLCPGLNSNPSDFPCECGPLSIIRGPKTQRLIPDI